MTVPWFVISMARRSSSFEVSKQGRVFVQLINDSKKPEEIKSLELTKKSSVLGPGRSSPYDIIPVILTNYFLKSDMCNLEVSKVHSKKEMYISKNTEACHLTTSGFCKSVYFYTRRAQIIVVQKQ